MENQINGNGLTPGNDQNSFEKRTSKQGYFYVEPAEEESIETEDTMLPETDHPNEDDLIEPETDMESENNTIGIFRSPEDWKKLNSSIDILLRNLFRNVPREGNLELNKEDTAAYAELMALKTHINEIL